MMHTYKECFFDEDYVRGMEGILPSKKDPVVIDIGANVGYFSLWIFMKKPKAKVFAFEPMKSNFELLKKYASENPNFNFEFFNCAVAGKPGTLTLNYDAEDDFTTAATVFDNTSQKDKIEVEAKTLQAVMDEFGMTNVDLLKLDCEGAEYDIIYNLPDETFSRIDTIVMETHQGLAENENTAAMAGFLREKAYEVVIDRSKLWARRN